MLKLSEFHANFYFSDINQISLSSGFSERDLISEFNVSTGLKFLSSLVNLTIRVFWQMPESRLPDTDWHNKVNDSRGEEFDGSLTAIR